MKIILTDSQKEFQKIKRYVVKKVPGASTLRDASGHYHVIDSYRENVVASSFMLPPALSVRSAWEHAKFVLWYSNMINKSNNAFSEDKMFKSLVKESGGGND